MIRLKAIAISPAGIKMIDQGHRVTPWALIPGLDGAGVVEPIGEHVKKFKVRGSNRVASYQEVAVVKKGMVARKPGGGRGRRLQACPLISLGISLRTPLPFLPSGPRTGFNPSSVLILGGSSAVCAAAIQFLRLAIPEYTILVTALQKHHNHLSTLGPTMTLDRSPLPASLISDVKATTPCSFRVDAIIDTIGAGSTERWIFDALSEKGAKRYAQVWTGDEEIEVPEGVD